MGTKTGFHSGEATADQIKVGSTYVNERQFIPQEQLNVTYISGTAAISGAFTLGSAQGVPTYKFTEDLNDMVSFRFVAPSSLKRKTECNLKLYWTSALSGATAGDVVWDADYWVISRLVSGTEISGKNYNLSGVVQDGNVTVTTEYRHTASTVSGVLQVSELPIPAEDIAPNDFVIVQVLRDGSESADTLECDIALVGVLIEYVEA